MANLNIRVDDKLKSQAEAIFSQLGLSITSATNIFLKQVVRHNGIPFELKIDPFYSEENMNHLKEAKKRMESLGGIVHDLIEEDYD